MPFGYPTGSSNNQGVTSRNVNSGNDNANGGSSEGSEKGDQQEGGSDDSSKVLSAGPGVVAEVIMNIKVGGTRYNFGGWQGVVTKHLAFLKSLEGRLLLTSKSIYGCICNM